MIRRRNTTTTEGDLAAMARDLAGVVQALHDTIGHQQRAVEAAVAAGSSMSKQLADLEQRVDALEQRLLYQRHDLDAAADIGQRHEQRLAAIDRIVDGLVKFQQKDWDRRSNIDGGAA